MMLSIHDLSTALIKVFLPRKEDSDNSQVFFQKMVDEDIPTHYSLSNYFLGIRRKETR